MKEKRVTAGAFRPSRYLTSADRDSVSVGLSAKEPPTEIDLEDSNGNGEKDQPGKLYVLRYHDG